MPTHVYANNNEIASKASEGKSIAAFPDVCFSPPAPPVGPMPLPYPNTGECTNTDKGTSKVFIKDKMSGMEGDSNFSKSMGDESATQNFNKGMITSALQGKCYFGLWSMDVQMEGKGVPRHLDMVTHNHGSQPGQIPGTDMDNQTVIANGGKEGSVSKENSRKTQLIGIDIYRPSDVGSEIAYKSKNLNKDEVFDSLGDISLLSLEDIIQYVNITGQKSGTINLPDKNIYYKNRFVGKIKSRSQLGNKVKLRIRFNKKQKFEFNFCVKKSGVIYSNNEVENDKNAGKNVRCKVNNNEFVSKEYECTLTTNDHGYADIDITLNATCSLYTFSATYHSDRVDMKIEARNKIFIRTFVPSAVSTQHLNIINRAVEDACLIYSRLGIDLECRNVIKYDGSLIYAYGPSNSDSKYKGILALRDSQNKKTFQDKVSEIIYQCNFVRQAEIDVFILPYIYMCDISIYKNASLIFNEEISQGAKPSATISLANVEILNRNITSKCPVCQIVIYASKAYTFIATESNILACEVDNVTYSIECATVSSNSFSITLCEQMYSILKEETNFKCDVSYYRPRVSGGMSFPEKWRVVFASLFPVKGTDDFGTCIDMNTFVPNLEYVISHEIAHRIGLVSDGEKNKNGCITIDRSPALYTGPIKFDGQHCNDTTCIMFGLLDPANGTSGFCRECKMELKKSDMSFRLPCAPINT